MAGRGRQSTRSRVISFLKFGLPLAALSMMAAVFLISEQPSDTPGLTFAPTDLEAMASGLRVTEPRFSGASANGDLFNFQAAEVLPADLELSRAYMMDLWGRAEFLDGMIVTLSAARAEMSLANRTVSLVEDVRLLTSDGYVAGADRIDVDIAAGIVEGQGRVNASGPLGSITAQRMRIAPVTGADGPPAQTAGNTLLSKDTLITFDGGVTLRYVPATAATPEGTDP